MSNTAKRTKLLFGFLVVLAVILIAAFSLSSQAYADDISDDIWGTVDDDYLSTEGYNFKGNPHFYLLIENYMFLPDDATITFDCPVWGYHQTLTKQDLVGRLGYVRLPADVRVTISSGTYTNNFWKTADLTVEGSQLFYTGTMIPGIDNTVRADSCDILMLGPVGGHVVGIWAGLGDRVNPNPGGGDDPDNPNPGGGDDPDNPNPGGGDDPNNPNPGGGDDPNNPNPGGGDDPNNPNPGGGDDPDNPNPGGGDDPDNPNPGGGDDPDPKDPDDPNYPGPKDDGDDPNGDGDDPKDSPETGDDSHYELLWVIAVIALTTFAATYRKKND